MNKKSPIIKNIIFILLGLFLFSFDRLLKHFSRNSFFDSNNLSIGDFLKLDYFQNQNISFSIPTGNTVALIISSLILILFITYYLLKIKNNRISVFSNYQIISFLLIFIGTISNIIDRLKFGYVIDYINLLNINIFNLADVFIIIGFLMFTLKEIKWYQK